MNVAAEPVQLGDRDRDRALAMLGLSRRGSQLRAAIKRVGTFAGLDLDELTGQLEDLGLGEPGNGLALRPVNFMQEGGVSLPPINPLSLSKANSYFGLVEPVTVRIGSDPHVAPTSREYCR